MLLSQLISLLIPFRFPVIIHVIFKVDFYSVPSYKVPSYFYP